MQVLSLETWAGLLLIPVSMVVQITGRAEEQSFLDHDLSFIRASIIWRGYKIPLVFSSEMLGDKQGGDDSYRRSVILWPMKGDEKSNPFALSSLISPRMISVDNEVGSSTVDAVEKFNNNGDARYALECILHGEKLGIIPKFKTSFQRNILIQSTNLY